MPRFSRNMLGVNHRFAEAFVLEMHRAFNMLLDPMKLSDLKPFDLINRAVGGGFVRLKSDKVGPTRGFGFSQSVGANPTDITSPFFHQYSAKILRSQTRSGGDLLQHEKQYSCSLC